MSRRTKHSVAMKGLNMSKSDTRTSAASNESPNSGTTSKPAAAPAPGGKTPTPRNPGPGPTDLVRPGEKPAPAAASDKTPSTPRTDDASAGSEPATDAKGVSGGFSGINNWLDSLPEPNWERLGDKIFAAPSTFKSNWRKRRIERAKAAELKEQDRLLTIARAEALAEAAKREAARLAHQSKVDAAAHDAAEAQRAAQAKAEARLVSAETARLDALAAKAKANLPVADKAAANADLPAADKPKAKRPVADKTAAKTAAKADLPAADKTAANSTPSAPAPAAEKIVDPKDLAALVASAKAAIDLQQSTAEPVYVAPYTLPDFAPNPAGQPSDVPRRILGSAAAVAGTVVSLAVLDTLVSGTVESLGSNYSMMSLTPTVHLIWPVIFIWAMLGAAFSWSPDQRSAVRQRAVGIPFALACIAAILWMAAALNSWWFPAFIASAASCWFLYTAVLALNRHTARTTVERMLTDAPVSLMTGFSLVLLASTFTNMLASWGAGGAGIWVATLLVPAVGYAAMTLTMTERGRIIMAIGVGWGMFWLLVPRVLGTTNSIWIAILAGMAAFVVLLATENRRYQIHHAEHRAARGKSTDFS